jgi:hypothetical protein
MAKGHLVDPAVHKPGLKDLVGENAQIHDGGIELEITLYRQDAKRKD